jgi:hypothetical protein
VISSLGKNSVRVGKKQTHIDFADAYNARIDTVKGLVSRIKALLSFFANLQITKGNLRSDISNAGSRTRWSNIV